MKLTLWFSLSGNDELQPSQHKGERLLKLLPKSKCELRKFDGCGHFLFLVYVILHFDVSEWMSLIVFEFKHASSWSISSKRYKISKTLIWCLYLAGRKHWPGNCNQGNFILPPWQASQLFIWFYSPNAWWGEKSNRNIQVNTIGLIWSYI